MSIPTISLNCASQEEIAKSLRDACIKFGFFYLEDHSIPQSLLDDVFFQSQKLFALPMEHKLELSDSVLTRGYTRFEEETLDPINQKRGDTKEGFYIGDEVDVQYMDPKKLRGPNIWPTSFENCITDEECGLFRETMEKYRREAVRVCMELVKYFAMSLTLSADGSDPHLFDEYFTEPSTFIRLLHYSAEESAPREGVYACGAHSDYGMLTLLLTDDNPGLQILTSDGTWINVPPKKGVFVVNIGDMFERWTNGLYKSTIHRVITPRGAKERYSVPFFFEPNFDALVECLESCCNEDNPAKFPPITAGQHLLNMYALTHADFTASSSQKA
jgi:isopenicillin N synthase-like dioxygenase